MWLAPKQVRLLTVNDDVLPYATKIAAQMKKAGIRVEINGGASIPKLIRWARQRPGWCVCVMNNNREAGMMFVKTSVCALHQVSSLDGAKLGPDKAPFVLFGFPKV